MIAFAAILLTAPVGTPVAGQIEVETNGRRDLPINAQDKGELVCRVFTETGSRVSKKRLCKTLAEWEDDRQENAAVMRQKRGAAGGPQPGNEG
ncbi:MAG: hypothetical protein ACK4GD_08265 [Sphingomonadaceae bacterium]